MKKGLRNLLAALDKLDDRDLEELGIGGRTKLSLPEVEELPTTSQAAIRIFNDRYLDGTQLPPDPTWASELGEIDTSLASPYVTYPMSLLSLKFKETKGENRFEGPGEQSFDLKPVEFDEGVRMPLAQIQTSVFAQRKWVRGPELLRRAEARHVAQNIADNVIDANPKCGWDKLALFHDAHLINPRKPELGTFDNLEATPTDMTSVDNITAQIVEMMKQVKDENGSRLIIEPRFAILAGPGNYQAIANLLKQDLIVKAILNEAATDIAAAATQKNPYAGLIEVVYAPQWGGGSSGLDTLLIDRNLVDEMTPPWLAGKWSPGGSLELRVFDEASDFFKTTGDIAISNHIWWGFGAVFPHAVRYVTGV